MLKRLLAATALVLLAAAAPASAADPIMPLGEVQAGMHCIGLTVVRGVDIGTFNADVIDVVAGDPIQQQPLILVRVSGGVSEGTGAAEGYSGSPIVCDGRIIGALAYGTGDYGNQLVLVTPIEAMLGQPVPTPAATRSMPGLLRAAKPLATPISIGGATPSVLAPFAAAAAKAGIRLQAVPAAPLTAAFPFQELRPGASMAAGLASGDLTAGAIGTVTYVDGSKVWGFGHPMDGSGARSLLLQDAYVYTVIGNPIDASGITSMKMAAPGHDVGALTYDGRNGVGGVVGTLPPLTALKVTTRNGNSGATRTWNVQVADEVGVGLPDGVSPITLIAPYAAAQAAYTALDGAPAQQSARMCVRITLRELPAPTGFCKRYVGTFGGAAQDSSGNTVSAPAPYAGDLSAALGSIDGFVFGTPHITAVDVDLDVQRGLEQAFLRSVEAPAVVRRGSTIRLSVELQRYRGATFTRTATMKVPRSLPRGPASLELRGTPADSSDASSVLQILLGSDGGDGGLPGQSDTAKTFPELAKQIRGLAGVEAVQGAFVRPKSSQPVGIQDVLTDEALRLSGSASAKVVVR